MKSMNRLYERLTPVERFKIAVAAFGRGDLVEVDRLNDSTPPGEQSRFRNQLTSTGCRELPG
jgi:hypothetical protein